MMKELLEKFADMCAIFHGRLRLDGFSRKEALELTKVFAEATVQPKNIKEKSKEEK